ncbi:calmodulin-like protein 2 [Pistacia vera]|uniref:calmodulin-like protein 2 n=1 Tax=Pistacia vera TaxID=55513 RepID=UPI0012638B6A|nr:calmodulin-like protein 2 [Pistacia vera]
MLGISGVCSRIIGELVQVLGVSRSNSTHIAPNSTCKPANERQIDELMLRALTAVFGMEDNGKIKKEKARRVVEKLGLIYGEEEKSSFDLPGEEEVPVEEALGELEDEKKRNELLREAFKIFDEDGNGYIEATELKRVLECLGLDKGWNISEIEKMLKVVDLNLDGKVDFGEFELMMG